MYINITDSLNANNKGSSRELVHYLEKENRIKDKLEPEFWFNHTGNRIEPYEVRNAIDGNIAKLCKADAKFFLVNISPSQKELKFLKEEYGKKEMKKQLKKYAEKVMDEYAKNFKREGIGSAKDLMWFGKIENHRYYGHRDKEVMNGERKRGERKEGNQMHIQIIISRKDATNRIKLSPMNNSRGKNVKHSLKLGQFNRVAFKQCGEALFDKQFSFERQLNETMAFANINKNGSREEKVQLDVLKEGAKLKPENFELAKTLVNEVSNGIFASVSDMLSESGKGKDGFLDILLEPTFDPFNYKLENEERRKKREHSQSQGLSR